MPAPNPTPTPASTAAVHTIAQAAECLSTLASALTGHAWVVERGGTAQRRVVSCATESVAIRIDDVRLGLGTRPALRFTVNYFNGLEEYMPFNPTQGRLGWKAKDIELTIDETRTAAMAWDYVQATAMAYLPKARARVELAKTARKRAEEAAKRFFTKAASVCPGMNRSGSSVGWAAQDGSGMQIQAHVHESDRDERGTVFNINLDNVGVDEAMAIIDAMRPFRQAANEAAAQSIVAEAAAESVAEIVGATVDEDDWTIESSDPDQDNEDDQGDNPEDEDSDDDEDDYDDESGEDDDGLDVRPYGAHGTMLYDIPRVLQDTAHARAHRDSLERGYTDMQPGWEIVRYRIVQGCACPQCTGIRSTRRELGEQEDISL